MSFTHVQGTGANSGGSQVSSLAATFASSVTAGNIIVVGLQGQGAGSPATWTLSDNKGNTYEPLAKLIQPDTGNNVNLQVWYTVVATGGTGLQITVAGSQNLWTSISIDEYSYSGTLTVESIVNGAYSSSSSPQTGTMSLAGSGLAYGIFETLSGSGNTWGAGTGTNLLYNVARTPGATIGYAASDILNPTGPTVNPEVTLATASTVQALGICLGTLQSNTWNRVQGNCYANWGQGNGWGSPQSAVSISLQLSVSVGDLVLIGVLTANTTSSTPTVTVSDGSNTYVNDAHYVTTQSGPTYLLLDIWRSVVTTGGTLTLTITPSQSTASFCQVSVDHYKFTGTLSVDSTSTGTATSTTASTGSLTVSGTDLLYGIAAVTGTPVLTDAWTPASGVNIRSNICGLTNVHYPMVVSDALNVTSSKALTWTLPSNGWVAAGVAYEVSRATSPPYGMTMSGGSMQGTRVGISSGGRM